MIKIGCHTIDLFRNDCLANEYLVISIIWQVSGILAMIHQRDTLTGFNCKQQIRRDYHLQHLPTFNLVSLNSIVVKKSECVNWIETHKKDLGFTLIISTKSTSVTLNDTPKKSGTTCSSDTTKTCHGLLTIMQSKKGHNKQVCLSEWPGYFTPFWLVTDQT